MILKNHIESNQDSHGIKGLGEITFFWITYLYEGFLVNVTKGKSYNSPINLS